MEQYQGKTIFNKIAIGKVFFYQKRETQVKRQHIENAETEIVRFDAAKKTALAQLDQIYEKALQEVGADNAAVFAVHKMMMEDEDYLDSVYNMIRGELINAEYAVAATGDNFAKMFAQMDDAYMQARAADVRDISERLIAVLSGSGTIAGTLAGSRTGSAAGTENVAGTGIVTEIDADTDIGNRTGTGTDMLASDEPVILMADDLAPSETVQMDKSRILAFVTRRGSSNSHTAILARSMNIPAVIGIDIREEWAGKTAIVDGYTGTVIIDPDAATLEQMSAKMLDDERRQQLLKELRGKETITRSGKKIHLYANIGSVSDVAQVLENDGEGIGLFRSEFLYLESDTFPTEEEQFKAYKMVAQNMAGKKVIVRTLDIGADKQADYFHLEKEDNPAMGYRAIRICLDQQEIFRTQLRALLRASAFGNISIMFPMIISVQEVLESKRILEEVKTELREQNIPYKDVEVGIMIETPAAVWISEELAKEVDFFSIGTNDLTQYTLAIDRQNPKLDSIYDPHHPAVLRSIRMVIENGHRGGAWVGICGELGADTSLTETFVEMGIDELSVSPSFILPVREAVRKLS
ncbi:MAG: phosphoenolpyruvate--protein phosphotransferase [Lachnospiraceae bacterium]|nr:phosphoenolpyruvate--protein phosphotransferase [Lachnospiraceae bacterium]